MVNPDVCYDVIAPYFQDLIRFCKEGRGILFLRVWHPDEGEENLISAIVIYRAGVGWLITLVRCTRRHVQWQPIRREVERTSLLAANGFEEALEKGIRAERVKAEYHPLLASHCADICDTVELKGRSWFEPFGSGHEGSWVYRQEKGVVPFRPDWMGG